jgi:cytochrome c-type biogenesis protein CcmH/NrfG
MYKATQNGSAAATWTSVQAYGLAVFCLALGVTLGYLFRGSAPPAIATATSSAPITAGMGPATLPSLEPQADSAQQQAELEKKAAPLLISLKQNPNDFDSIVKIANLYYDAQQYNDAIPYYERALKIHPENSDVRTDLGTASWYLGNADRAITEFERALKYQPSHPGTLFNLGVVRWQGKKDPAGAVNAWEELLKRNPDFPKKAQVEEMISRARQHSGKS